MRLAPAAARAMHAVYSAYVAARPPLLGHTRCQRATLRRALLGYDTLVLTTTQCAPHRPRGTERTVFSGVVTFWGPQWCCHFFGGVVRVCHSCAPPRGRRAAPAAAQAEATGGVTSAGRT